MKRYFYPCILCLCMLMTGISLAQNVSPSWTAFYRGTGDNSDRFNRIIPDGAGNFIGVGYTVRPGNYRDFLTIKFTPLGDTLWKRTKNGKGNGDDEIVAAGVDASGNVYVTGYSDEDLSTDIRTIKYDSNGLVVWDTLYNSVDSLDDEPVELKIDANGNCIVAGNVEPDTVTGSSDFITLKYDPSGALLWAQQYSNSGAASGKDEVRGMVLGLDGNVYVTGRSFNGTTDDFLTIKYDINSGSLVWFRSYDGTHDDRSNCIVADHSGNIIIAGQSGNGDNYDYRTIKYDSTGLFLWTKLYNAPLNQDDIPTAIAVDPSDNVIVTGEVDTDINSISTNFDFQTLKYRASDGNPFWVQRIGNVTQQDDHPNSIAIDGVGNIFITGKSDQNNAPLVSDEDFMTVMYNTNGNLQWSGAPLYHAGTASGEDDVASCVIVDDTYIYVAGGAFNTTTQRDATVVKYEIATGNVVWVRNYNYEGDFNESARDIVVDANNNSYAAGYTFNQGQNLDALITKIDPAGNVVCNYQYKGFKGDDDEFYAIGLSLNGFIYAAGYTKVIDQKRDMLLVKWDPATCDTVWTRTYNYINQSDRAESMVLDAAGNIYITGRSDSNPVDSADNNDIVTIKYDSNGNQLWLQRYNGTGNLKDEPAKIILDNAGNVIVAGRTENIHDDDFIILKYNANTGMPVWALPVTYGGPFANDDRVTDVVVDASDNIFVTGYSQTSSGDASQDPVVLKYDANGNYLQGYFSVGDDKDEATKITIDINNNVYVFYTYDADGGIPFANNNDFLLRKYTNNLDSIIFEKQYDSPIHGDDVPAAMIMNPSGDVFITGGSENDTSANRVNKNWLTIGYDDSGPQIFISNYDGPNATDDSPNAMFIRGTSFWICGNTEGTNNNQKDLTVNYYNLSNVSVSEAGVVSGATVFPNPFHNEARLRLSMDNYQAPLYLEIFDLIGNSVRKPVEVPGNPIIIQRGNLASGIYQYRISNNSSVIAHGKLIIN